MKHTFFLLMASFVFVIACSKKSSDPPPAAPSPVGFWSGNIGNGSSLNLYYAALVRANGTVRIYQGASGSDSSSASAKSEGTWTATGTTLKFVYKFASGTTPVLATVSSNANFNNATGQWEAGDFKGGLTLTK